MIKKSLFAALMALMLCCTLASCEQLLDSILPGGLPCSHEGGEATCATLAVCDKCGEEYGEYDDEAHFASSTWTVADGKHYRQCMNGCGTKLYEGTHSGGTATCQKLARCSTCGQEYGDYNMNSHRESNDWTYADGAHYHACLNGCYVKFDYAKCDGEATCTTAATCSVCGSERGGDGESGHSVSDEWSAADGYHYHACENGCGKEFDITDCTMSAPTCVAPSTCPDCGSTEGEPDATAHAPASEWTYEGGKHYHECLNGCGEKFDEADCSGGEANCAHGAVCSVCENEYSPISPDLHNYSTEWSYENGKHFKACQNGCGGKTDEADCSGGAATCVAGAVCEVCENTYTSPVSTAHAPASEWTNEDGKHYHACQNGCGTKLDEGECDGVASCTGITPCSVCGDAYDGELSELHTPTGGWIYDNGKHYKACANGCGTRLYEAECDGEATCAHGAICTVCGTERGEADASKHVGDGNWIIEGNGHYQMCKFGCGVRVNEGECDGVATCMAAATCSVCGTVRGERNPENHKLSANLYYTSSTHYNVCDYGCGTIFNEESHTLEWTVTKESTLTEAGERTGACVDCDYTTPAEALGVSILKVKDGAGGIVVLIQDDGHAEAGLLLDELLAKYGKVADLGATLNNLLYDHDVSKPTNEYYVWRELVETGRWSVISHSATHSWWGTVTNNGDGTYTFNEDEEKMYAETAGSQAILRQLFEGQRVLTFAYPGFSTEKDYTDKSKAEILKYVYSEKARELIMKYYIGARAADVQDSTYIGEGGEWDYLSGYYLDGKYEQYFREAAAGELKIFYIHSLVDAASSSDSYYATLSRMEDFFVKLDAYTDAGTIWNAHYDDAILYLRESESVKASIEKADGLYKLTLTLPDTMDTDIYNYPITTRVEVPSSWKAVKITHGESVSYAVAKTADGKWVIDANVVPNGTAASIVPVALSEVPEVEEPEVKPTPDYSNKTYTEDFSNENTVPTLDVTTTDGFVKAGIVDFEGAGKVYRIEKTNGIFYSLAFNAYPIHAEALDLTMKLYVPSSAPDKTMARIDFSADTCSVYSPLITKSAAGFYFGDSGAGSLTGTLPLDTWQEVKITLVIGDTSISAEYFVKTDMGWRSLGISSNVRTYKDKNGTEPWDTVNQVCFNLQKAFRPMFYVDDISLKAGTADYVDLESIVRDEREVSGSTSTADGVTYLQKFDDTPVSALPTLDATDTTGTDKVEVVELDNIGKVYHIDKNGGTFRALSFALPSYRAAAFEWTLKLYVDSASASGNPIMRVFFGDEKKTTPYMLQLQKGTSGFTFADTGVDSSTGETVTAVVTSELSYNTWHEVKLLVTGIGTTSFKAEYFVKDSDGHYASIGSSTRYNPVTGTNTVDRIYMALTKASKAELYIDDMALVAGTAEYVNANMRGVDDAPACEHVAADTWTTEGGKHYKACTKGCGTRLYEAECDDVASCLGTTPCTVCGYEYEGDLAALHTPTGPWLYDGGAHYKACANDCGVKLNAADCSGGAATCTSGAKCQVCENIYTSPDSTAHSPADGGITENGTHYHECANNCGTKLTVGECQGGEATCASGAVCEVCNNAYTTPNPDAHSPSDEWTTEDCKHYHECENGCGTRLDEANCSGGNTCNTCGEAIVSKDASELPGDIDEDGWTSA